MNLSIKMGYAVFVCGGIMLGVSAAYIPPTGGTIPQGMPIEEFDRIQRDIVYSSTAFKTTMAGLGIVILSMLYIYVKTGFDDGDFDNWTARIEPHIQPPPQTQPPPHVEVEVKPEVKQQAPPQVKSALKVSRSQVVPSQGPIDDSRPQVNSPPLSSPPIQLVPTIMELKPPRPHIIHNMPRVYKKFVYPAPYNKVNR